MTTLRVYIAVPILCACIAPFSNAQPKPEKLAPSIRSWADTGIARRLADLIDRIERGDMKAWDDFATYDKAHLSGEHAETYDTACGELARRDPTIFLRRHLMDDNRAIPVGKRAYGWIGTGGRHTMNWLHKSRLELSRDRRERREIAEYIAALNTVLASIDKEYR